jgi:TonB-linked SusC/RagA family outer membrane protein
MKLTTFLLMIALVQASAATFAQKLTYRKQGASLKEVFAEIKNQTGYNVLYSPDQIDPSKKISANFKQTELKEVLEKLINLNTQEYSIVDKNILIKEKEKSFLENVIARFQNIDIGGRVVDEKGLPLIGASVSIKGGRGTITDKEGNFHFTKVDEKSVLVIAFIGYLTREVNANADLTSIQLETSNSGLNEVQVIGYGTVSKKLNTGNVVSIKAADIEKQPVNNPILALQGLVAGVEINQVNGIAGGAVRINIRGINSLLQGTDPLFVVDGIPYNSNLFNNPGYGGLGGAILGAGGGNTNQNIGLNPLSFINPKDIESIDVLKDADATAIYGSRGSNGVVLITTKKGKAGTTLVDINMQQGYGEVARRAKLLNTEQYLSMRTEAFSNDNVVQTVSNARDLLVWDQNSYSDWQDMMIGGTSQYTNAQASISGGNVSTQFLISGNYHRETTVFPGDWSDKNSGIHLNINNTSPNQKFKVSISGNFRSDNNQLPITDFTQFITIAPNAPSLTNPDGSLNWAEFGANPFQYKEIKYVAKTNSLIGNSVLSYLIFPGLEAKISLGYSSIYLDEKTLNPSTANNPASGVTTGSGQFNTNFSQSWIVEPQLNYTKDIGKGHFGVLLGGTAQKRSIEGQILYGDGYADDGLLGSLAGAATVTKSEVSIFENYRYSSLFMRINYNFDDRYVVNLTGRRDGSSRFGPGRQYGNFSAIGAAWLFSNETFFKGLVPLVSFGKIRASFGTSGNEPGSNYSFLELYNLSPDYTYGGGIGIYPNNLPDADYRWEINKKLEAGLELGFFENILSLTASYFRNRSSNQLINFPFASSVGFESITANLQATIQNQGWEFTVGSTNVKTANFRWSTGLNISTNRNKLLEFPGLDISPYNSTFIIGEPVNVRQVYQMSNIDPVTGRYQFHTSQGGVTSEPVFPDDRGARVNLNPTYYGGVQNRLNYKRWDIDFNFQFVKQKGQNYLFTNNANPGRFNNFTKLGNQPTGVLNRWKQENDDTEFQKFTQNAAGLNSYNLAKGSDLAFSDASFIRLKNISISYALPEKVAQRLLARSFRIYLQAQNLLTITNYEGTDPETQSVTALPTLRVITAGLQITL